MATKKTTATNRLCKFKIRGGGFLVVPIDRIDFVEIDDTLLKSKIHILGRATPVTISDRPEDILNELSYEQHG